MEKELTPIPSLILKETFKLSDPAKKITLLTSRPMKEGESEYGKWYLWKVAVEDAVVKWKEGNKIEKGYTGEAFMFPSSDYMNDTMLEITGGEEEDVEISIKKEAEETKKGLRSRYVLEKLSAGGVPESSFTPTESALINDAKIAKKSGMEVSEKAFIILSQEDDYEGKINAERAKELYKFL